MEFELINSKRRTVTLEISYDGRLIVRGPMSYTREEAAKFVEKNRKWIEKRLPSVLSRYGQTAFIDSHSTKEARTLTREICTYLVNEYASIMGVTHSDIKITSAKKRFGSCSGKNGLCFSYYLVLYPFDAIKYVVVHELAHILHHDHSKAFHNRVRQFLPDADSAERLLSPENASFENLQKNMQIILSLKGENRK